MSDSAYRLTGLFAYNVSMYFCIKKNGLQNNPILADWK